MNDWTNEQQRCLQFAGLRFVAYFCGYTYEWLAEKPIYARKDDRKPYLVARPVKRLSGKRGWLRAPQVFHAENLPPV